eukprot:scaffold2462_cov402-Prasinococcus_capsulatus_cf.AAC.7
MQRRSEAASAAANAQQQPQLDWSRMSLISVAQCGQCSAESKCFGSKAASPSESANSSTGTRLNRPRASASTASS